MDHGSEQGHHVSISKLQQISPLPSRSAGLHATTPTPLATMAGRREQQRIKPSDPEDSSIGLIIGDSSSPHPSSLQPPPREHHHEEKDSRPAPAPATGNWHHPPSIKLKKRHKAEERHLANTEPSSPTIIATTIYTMRSGTSPQPPPAGTAAEEGLGSARFTGVDSQTTVGL